MQQPESFIYFRHLSAWDYLTILGYTFITAIVFFVFKVSIKPETQVSVMAKYGIFTQWALIYFNYKSLRNFSVFCVWLLFALLHLATYYYIKDIPALFSMKPVLLTSLRNTWMILLWYQVLRVISFVVQDCEFVMPIKRSDVFDERTPTIYDIMIFFLGMAAPFALVYV